MSLGGFTEFADERLQREPDAKLVKLAPFLIDSPSRVP
jgi:hypothetical protein